jgi:hypothetical protein
MTTVKLTGTSGQPLDVVLEHIAVVQQQPAEPLGYGNNGMSEPTTLIMFTGGAYIYVRDAAERVVALLEMVNMRRSK